MKEAWPPHSSFHPPLYLFLPLLLLPPVRDRLTHVNHLSEMQPLTPLQSGPRRWMAQGRDRMNRVPAWDQHQQRAQKEFPIIVHYPLPRTFYHLLLQIYIYNTEIIELSEQGWVWNHTASIPDFSSKIWRKWFCLILLIKASNSPLCWICKCCACPPKVRKNIHLLHRHPRLLIRSYEEQQCNTVHPPIECAFFLQLCSTEANQGLIVKHFHVIYSWWA